MLAKRGKVSFKFLPLGGLSGFLRDHAIPIHKSKAVRDMPSFTEQHIKLPDRALKPLTQAAIPCDGAHRRELQVGRLVVVNGWELPGPARRHVADAEHVELERGH